MTTGITISGMEYNLHHKNEDRTDDRFENLELIPHVDHILHHNPKTVVMVDRNCLQCGGTFQIKSWRLKDKSRGKFCGQKCYRKSGGRWNKCAY